MSNFISKMTPDLLPTAAVALDNRVLELPAIYYFLLRFGGGATVGAGAGRTCGVGSISMSS